MTAENTAKHNRSPTSALVTSRKQGATAPMHETTYPRKPWRWPGGQKIAMSIGLAFEAFERHSQFSTSAAASRGKINHFSLSYADYGWKSGVWRFLELFDRYGLK